ncbi:MAG: H-NS histone family protein [Rhodocyclaceae bacterium]|nr:H-NS histone family protein [Rhodocyclaceae bacterium]
MELSAMSPVELKKLATLIEKEVTGRSKKNLGQAIVEIKAIVIKYNVTLAEVVAASTTTTRKPRDKTAPKKRAARSPKKAKVFLYQHPDNADLVWSGGRGRRPVWVTEWINSGVDIEKARIIKV